MTSHDAKYRDVFSHPQILRELLEFVKFPYIEKLDIEKAILIEATTVLASKEKRIGDILYEVPLKNEENKLMLLIEHQSGVDYKMSFRFFEYLAQALAKFRKKTLKKIWKRKSYLLPSVACILLYNGEPKWTSSNCVSDLMAHKKEWGQFFPKLKYHLVDIKRIPAKKLAKLKNFLGSIFRLDQKLTPQEMVEELFKLIPIVHKPENAAIAEDLLKWLYELVEEMNCSQKTKEQMYVFLEKLDRKEPNMLLTKVIARRWSKSWAQWEAETEARGKAIGEANGAVKTLRKSIARLLKIKFEIFPEKVAERLNKIEDADVLQELLDQILSLTEADLENFAEKEAADAVVKANMKAKADAKAKVKAEAQKSRGKKRTANGENNEVKNTNGKREDDDDRAPDPPKGPKRGRRKAPSREGSQVSQKDSPSSSDTKQEGTNSKPKVQSKKAKISKINVRPEKTAAKKVNKPSSVKRKSIPRKIQNKIQAELPEDKKIAGKLCPIHTKKANKRYKLYHAIIKQKGKNPGNVLVQVKTRKTKIGKQDALRWIASVQAAKKNMGLKKVSSFYLASSGFTYGALELFSQHKIQALFC